MIYTVFWHTTKHCVTEDGRQLKFKNVCLTGEIIILLSMV